MTRMFLAALPFVLALEALSTILHYEKDKNNIGVKITSS